jgi:hypothetical protein
MHLNNHLKKYGSVEKSSHGVNWYIISGICLWDLKKTQDNTPPPLSKQSRSPGQDLNPGPSEYEVEMISTNRDFR